MLRALTLLAVLGCLHCGGGAPADHTIDLDGAYHKSGLKAPTTNCVECHGATLRGGAGPSCYDCHGKKW